MYIVEKFAMGEWRKRFSRDTLEEAIAACEYFNNLQPGRVTLNGAVVWTDENVPPTPMQAVADKDGELVGFQPK